MCSDSSAMESPATGRSSGVDAKRTKTGEGAPSMLEWRELYEAAMRFNSIACWNWMWDSDVFGVQDPASGEIGYCCVMGRLGLHFGLAVYLGTEGLEGYLKIQSSNSHPSFCGMIGLQRCLMASFEDRGTLSHQDRRLIKKLGLKFRGRNSWPLFRSYEPGYYPWYLTAKEARYLNHVLKQATELSLRFRNDPEMLIPPLENHYLVRVPEETSEGLGWRDEWLEPEPVEREEPKLVALDEGRVRSFMKRCPKRCGSWEVDLCYLPMAVRENNERPYYPRIIIWVDHHSELILHHHILRSREYEQEFVAQFFHLVKILGYLPEEIYFENKVLVRILEPIASRLRIRLRQEDTLMGLEHVKEEILRFSQGYR